MRLLFVVLTATETLLALTLLFFRATRRTYPGFGRWTIAEALQAGGYILLVTRGILPDAVSVIGANLAFPLAAVIRLEGAHRFFGPRPMPRAWYAVPAAALASGALFTFGPDAPGLRGAVNTLLIAVPLFATAALVLVHEREARPLFPRTIAALLVVLAIAMLSQAADGVFHPHLSPLRETPRLIGVFVLILLGHVAVAVAFLMLNAERMEAELSRAEAHLTRSVAELQQALAEVKTLSGLLPICAWCKKVRDDAGYWTQIEVYVRDRSEADFSHGICPECARKLEEQFHH